MYTSQYVTSFTAENSVDLTEKINEYLAEHYNMKIVSVSYEVVDNKSRALVVFEER